MPSFSVLMAADLLEVPLSAVNLRSSEVHLGSERAIPVDPSGQFRINWLGSEESIRRISYNKVLRGTVPSSFFKDKVVFLGGSAAGLEDLKTTPVDEQKPGVLVHAEAFLNIMNEAHLPEWSIWDLWPWLAIAALPFLAAILSMTPLYASILTLVLASIEFFGYLLYLFPAFGIVLPIGTILTFTLVTFIGGVVFKYVTEEWAKQRLREAFATYVDASVVDQVTENPEALELGGEKKRLTVLFSDVRQFTTYSEHLDPQEVVTFLNRFFDRLTVAVFEHDGTVDKFIGDGMMAIFGAPLETDQHATQACAAALSMSEALAKMNEENDFGVGDQGPDVPVSIGVGINTGEMVAGNIGSSQRFEYTVVGDAVNLAARLEPVNRLLGTRILVSDSTYDDIAPSDWTFRKMGSFRVKGREDAVTIYELMDPRRYEEPETLRTRFEEALEHYQRKDFERARTGFDDCHSIQPEDGPSQFYLDRCDRYLQDPSDHEEVLDLRNIGT